MAQALVIFGSSSDQDVFEPIIRGLKKEKIDFKFYICSAHRNPKELDNLLKEDYSLVIAGAGLAAHLPGVIASKTLKPVIGVPCHSNYEGLDALLSIMQMPPGVPVLAVGVGKAEEAVKNTVKILKHYKSVTLLGEEGKPMDSAIKILKEFDVPFDYKMSPNKETVNIEFTYFDEPIEKKDELVIYCPLLLEKDDKAEAALNLLIHSTHGLWVGLNRGENAALSAIQILNLDGSYETLLAKYRKRISKK